MGYAEELLQLCEDLQSCADEDVLGLIVQKHAPLLEQGRTLQEGDEQLSRAMVAASQHLLKLGASLSHQWQAAERAPAWRPHLALRLAAACSVAQHLTSLLPLPGLNPAAHEAAMHCVALLLEPSRLVLADTATAAGAAASAELVQCCNALRWSALELLHLVLLSADTCGAAGKLAVLVPPGPTIAFLSAAVAPGSEGALGSEASIATSRAIVLWAVCRRLLDHPACGRYGDLIKADAVLQQRLVGMLAHFLALASTVLSLPPERRPSDCEEGDMWNAVSHVASVVALPSLESGMHLHLAPQQHPAAGFSSNARRLLAASCQLLAATPLQVQPDMQIGPEDLAFLLLNLTELVNMAAVFMFDQVTPHRTSWPWGSTPHQLQPARLLAQTLARLPAVLPATVNALQDESAVLYANSVPRVYAAAGNAAALLAHLFEGDGGRQAQMLSDAADIPAWCAAASGALRAVPLAAEALQQQHRSELADKALAAMAEQLFYVAQHIVMACGSFLQSQARARWGPAASAAAKEPAGATLAAAETALWQLHTAACRMAHCTNALGAPLLQSPQLVHRLWFTTAFACRAASWLEAWAVGRVIGDTKPHLRAMACAHAPALQALRDLAGSPADLEAGERVLLLLSLALCAEFGVPAMATHAGTTRLLSEAARHLGTAPRAGARAGIAMDQLPLRVWDAIQRALRSPRLAAVLLDCGVVNWALRDAVTRLATLSAVDQETFSIRAANLLTALQHAGEWQAVMSGAAGVAGSAASDLARDLDQLGDALDAASEAADSGRLALLQRRALPPATRLSAALLEHWRRPEQWQRDTLALAQAAAARSCAYLRCANVAQEGGPAVGQGDGSAKCSACRVVWYCSEACSHADWRGPGSGQHKRCCKALKAARDASRGTPAAQ